MNCPEKTCLASLDDDSFFCDQCGRELRCCPVCKETSVKKFCPKHGKPTVPLKDSLPAPGILMQEPEAGHGRNTAPDAPFLPGRREAATIVARAPASNRPIRLVHSSGEVLECTDTTDLGRKNGAFAEFLSGFDTISRMHARIVSTPQGWSILDPGSANGTRLNGIMLKKDVPVPFSKGDVIILADQKFKVE